MSAFTDQPARALVATGKRKEGKTVDPPPIVEVRLRETGTDLSEHYLLSPYYFMCCSLYKVSEDSQVAPVPPSTTLAGTLVSSLYRIRDVDNSNRGYFVFGDLSVQIKGNFRLKFTLFEIQGDTAHYLQSIFSAPFDVSPPRKFPGMVGSTLLTRSFVDQGVKLRLRKRPRVNPQTSPSSSRYPDGTGVQTPFPAFSGSLHWIWEYGDSGGPNKRQRTTVDCGSGKYDAGGQMCQMEAHPQDDHVQYYSYGTTNSMDV
ncbi:hypothetical protein EYZ11_004606 [Aspergillus tanneri]|uniref:Velvet domain-containing protein n=1 Tax=Aspergillus tanneri TaxID=1220188 RepID=A0A4S3JKP8_9EURO|nr:hypothetical protein EYZ11_004606 [Aspergillus tanneri]